MEIIKYPNSIFSPQLGHSTKKFLQSLNFLSTESKENLIEETLDIIAQCANPNFEDQIRTGLVVGYVQSGKTMSFTTLISLANDNGYRFVVVLAGVANNLLNQTYNRLKKDLQLSEKSSRKYFKIFCNPEYKNHLNEIKESFLEENDRTIVITVLKHHQHITELSKILSQLSNLRKNSSCLIIDDEADQYSLNGKSHSNFKKQLEEQTATYASILKLKNSVNTHSYIQYTATPQGPILIAMSDLLKPQFCKVLTPGEKYTGGLEFFQNKIEDLVKIVPEDEIHNKNNILSKRPSSLEHALWDYLVSSSFLTEVEDKLNYTSMLIHPGRENKIITTYYNWTIDFITQVKTNLQINDKYDLDYSMILENINNSCLRILKTKEINIVDHVINGIKSILKDIKVYEVMKGQHTEIIWSDYTLNILIGGEMLNRGYTVENLTTTYLTRTSKNKSNSDTLQQRARFFGYKKDYINYCRVYLPFNVKEDFIEYVRHEESFRNKLKNGSLSEFLKNSLFEISNKLELTRKSILSGYMYNVEITGWLKFNTWDNNDCGIWSSIDISNTLSDKSPVKFYTYNNKGGTHSQYQINYQEIINLILNINVNTKKQSYLKVAILQVLSDYVEPSNNFELIIMNSDKNYLEGGRSRTVTIDAQGNNTIELFVGRNENYKGDESIYDESYPISIQIHSIIPKNQNMEKPLYFGSIRINQKYNFKTIDNDDDN
jgi:hypothetical protein